MKTLIFYFGLCFCLNFLIESVTSVSCKTDGTPGVDLHCQSSNYPNGYKIENCNCEFIVSPGYQVEVIIEDLDLDKSKQDNILLRSIGSNTNDVQIIASSYLNQPKQFLYNTNVHLEFNSFVSTSQYRGFNVHFKRNGVPATTTEQPTTVVTWPTPSNNDTIYHTIYLNVAPEIFKSKENDFKQLMANISAEYCENEENDIKLNENITVNNINFQMVIKCNYEWVDKDNCVEIVYAIPVILKENRYELTSENLRKMWEIYHTRLELLGWTVYIPPDNSYSLMIWLLISCSVLVAFLIFLFFIKLISSRFINIRNANENDMEHIITTPKRISDASLWPMSSQIVPPLFDFDSTVVYYEPDPVSNSLQITNNIINFDDMSDEEIMTVVNNTSKSNYSDQNTLILHNPQDKESAL